MSKNIPSEFDSKAADWDKNPMHWDRSVAITELIKELIPLNKGMTALEFGAGTGIASFLLKDHLMEITLMDNSVEMVKVMDEKIKATGVKNLKTLHFDMENDDFSEGKFDLIFTQMVLHHVTDVEKILSRFYSLLNASGYLAIADLSTEDGSFHGDGFSGHRGFDIDILSDRLRHHGFINVSHRKCFVIDRKISETATKKFDVFLLTAQRKITE
jgi:ubiquinone/menaquinone biosynthesis C-methylase UbiE